MSVSLPTLLYTGYAMEQRSLDILNGQLEIVDDADLHRQLKSHVVETKWQIKLLEACLEFQNLDKQLCHQKSCVMLAGFSHKGLLAFERFEVDLYKKLMAAAHAVHAPEILQSCKEILEQERAMVEWLEIFSMDPAFIPTSSQSYTLHA